jgi:hypothetical protein
LGGWLSSYFHGNHAHNGEGKGETPRAGQCHRGWRGIPAREGNTARQKGGARKRSDKTPTSAKWNRVGPALKGTGRSGQKTNKASRTGAHQGGTARLRRRKAHREGRGGGEGGRKGSALAAAALAAAATKAVTSARAHRVLPLVGGGERSGPAQGWRCAHEAHAPHRGTCAHDTLKPPATQQNTTHGAACTARDGTVRGTTTGHALALDLASHCHERTLNIGGVLGTGLQEGDGALVGKRLQGAPVTPGPPPRRCDRSPGAGRT